MSDVSGTIPGKQRLQACNSDDSMRRRLLGGTQRCAAMPADYAQGLTNVATQKSLVGHESGSNVAKQVVLVSGVVLSAKKVTDAVFNKSCDCLKEIVPASSI